MKTHLLVAFAAIVTACAPYTVDTIPAAEPTPEPTTTSEQERFRFGPVNVRSNELDQHIFYAVLEGLYADGVRNDVVDRILLPDGEEFAHFVPGCPTCIYVLEAFRHYRARPEFVSFKGGGDTWGAGLDAALRKRFFADDHQDRLAALQVLVNRWMQARMDRLRLTEKERRAWEIDLQRRAG